MDDQRFRNVLLDLITSNYDSRPTKNEKYAEQLVNVHVEFVNRNKKLSSLLEDYITDRKKRVDTNTFLKKFLFWCFVVLLLSLTAVVVITFISVDINEIDITSLASLFTVAVTYLASLISIFQIMSKYLFPIDEEKDTIEMIKTVVGNDIRVEELMSKAIHDNRNHEIQLLREYKQLLQDGIINENEYSILKESILKSINKSKI